MTHPDNTQQSGAEQPLERGAKARLTRDTPDGWHKHYREGFEFEIEEFVPALREGDRGFGDPDFIQEDFYYGNAGGGFNNVCVPANIVEQVMSAREMANRRPPSLEALRSFVGSECVNFGDGFTITSADWSGSDDVEFEGTTDEGLDFIFAVKVMSATEVNW